MTDCPDNRPFNTPSFCLRALHTRMPPSSARPARLEHTQAHHRSIYKPLSLVEGLYLITGRKQIQQGCFFGPACVNFDPKKKMCRPHPQTQTNL